MKITKSALIGLGAVGTVYGHLLHQTYGENFAVIADGSRSDFITRSGVALNQTVYHPQIVHPADTHFKADLIIVCVKNHQLDSAIADIKNTVTDDTIILPLLNGITARDRLSVAYPQSTVLYGLSLLIDALRKPEGVFNTNNGVVQFGHANNTHIMADIQEVDRYLNTAGIETQICQDMIRTIWRKWMLNVAYNQVSAITRFNFAQLAAIEPAQQLLKEALLEVVSLARAANVDLTERDADEIINTMTNFSPAGKTSMLQDIEACRATEVDYFAGTVIEYSEKLNVPTPVNRVLHHIIKALEQDFLQSGSIDK